MERSVFGSIALLILICETAPLQRASAAVEYTLTVIAPGAANSINDSGVVTGGAGTGDLQAFVYRNGVLNLFGLQTGDDSQGFGINSAGLIAGTAYPSSVLSRAFVRRPDGTITFPPLVSAFALNDAGVVAGSAVNGSAVDAATYDGTAVTDLPTLGGNSGIAFGINNAGLVVGRARDSAGVDHAAYWSNGNLVTLGTKQGKAEGVNAAGEIVGTNYFSGQGGDALLHATLWQNGAATDLTPNDTIGTSEANAINDAGVIVGYDGFATLWRNGVEQNLNDLIAPDSGLILYDALGINNLGQIVGHGRDKANTEQAFLLTPIPEPGAALTIIALAALPRTRARREIKGDPL